MRMSPNYMIGQVFISCANVIGGNIILCVRDSLDSDFCNVGVGVDLFNACFTTISGRPHSFF